jgi:hypothetical protein
VRVPSDQIVIGSIVKHSRSGLKGIVTKVDNGWRFVCRNDNGESYWWLASQLEWADANEAKPENPKDVVAVDKLPSHLVSPIVKAYEAIAHFLGNVKYGAWNFRCASVKASVYKSALDRHMDAFWEGEWYDPVDGTPHLANAKACLNILIEAHHAGTLIDDRPPSLNGELAKVRAEFEALMPKIREKYKDKVPRHFTIADTENTE